METPVPPPVDLPEDETGARLRRDLPDDDENIDAKLQLADLRRRLAGAQVEPVLFRRWEIVRRLGRGGMGAVYLARDPQLDRAVALKVLGAAPGAERSAMSQRLQREAQALACIDHPNVVKVHQVDLGSGFPVIEMEFVDGTTLRQWQGEKRHWREVLEAYIAVGQGLAAIHTAGLVHRDVKPDNLLRRRDGCIKIVDLGLAIGHRSSTTTSALPSAALLLKQITQTNGAAGTPAYMAPERFGRADGSAATDQFSFAVSLYEALHGVLPFRVEDPAQYVKDLQHGRIQVPADAPRLPRWLVRALRRSLSAKPEHRYPSMDAFVKRLRRGLRQRLWWWVGSTVLATSLGLTSLGWALRTPPEDPCVSLERSLHTDAEADGLGSIRSMVSREGMPHLQRAFRVLEETHFEHSRQWTDARLALCESQAHRQEPPADLELRTACLVAVRDELDIIATGPGPGEEDLAGWMVDATKALERLHSCNGPTEELRPWQASDSELHDQLHNVVVLERLGDYAQAEVEARAVLAASHESHPRLHAEALYRLGHILGSDERGQEAFDTLTEARNAAVRSGNDALMCDVVAYRAKLTAVIALDSKTSADDVSFAEACVKRTSSRSILVHADMLEARGLLAQAVGEPEQAVKWHREALALRRDHLGQQNYEVSKSLQNLANALEQAGDPEQAMATMTEALHVREAVLGAKHPKVADVLFDLGELQRESGNVVAARDYLEGARRILAEVHGPTAAHNANVHLSLALLELGQETGNLSAAADHLHRARELQAGDRNLRPSHPDRARLLQAEGILHVRRGDFTKALEAFVQNTEILRRHDPDSHEVHDGTLRELEMLYALRDHATLAQRVAREGQPLATHVARLEPQERGRFAWYVGDSSFQAKQTAQAVAYLRIALEAYEGLDDRVSAEELTALLRRATKDSAKRTNTDRVKGSATHGTRAD